MSELERRLKKLSVSEQYLEVGELLLKALQDTAQSTPQTEMTKNKTYSHNQTIDGVHFIAAFKKIFEILPSDQLPAEVFLKHLPLTAHGPFGLLILTSATLGQAFECFLNFLQQYFPFYEVYKVNKSNQTHFIFKCLYDFGDITAFLDEILMLSIFEGMQFLTQPVQKIDIYFTHTSLGKISDYEKAFKANFHFSSEQNEIVLLQKDLNIPLNTANPTTHSWIKSQLNFDNIQQLKATTLQVRRIILQAMQNNLIIDISFVANNLAMSTRTLSRKLNQEGNSFQKIKLEVGIEYAQNLLIESSKQIGEIAHNAGFDNIASFSRAFKRTTTQTPSQFRKSKLVK